MLLTISQWPRLLAHQRRWRSQRQQVHRADRLLRPRYSGQSFTEPLDFALIVSLIERPCQRRPALRRPRWPSVNGIARGLNLDGLSAYRGDMRLTLVV